RWPALSHDWRLGRGIRPAAGLRHAVPEPAGDAAVPADPDEGAYLRDRVRRDRTDARNHRLATGRGPFRAPRRHAVRVAGDPLLGVRRVFSRIAMTARAVVIVFGVIDLMRGIPGGQPGVAHFALLGGMLFGGLVIRYGRGQPPFGGGRRPPRGPSHLRRVK